MKKILSFIFNNDNQFLLLRNNPVDPIHGGDFWYTVTGGFEKGETDGRIVSKREIKEETNLDVSECMYLNLILKYANDGIEYDEYVYVSFVSNISNIILDQEENIDYKWCSLSEFVKEIRWYGNLEQLNEILELAIQKKLYFNNETTIIVNGFN